MTPPPPMTIKEVIDAVLRFLEIVITWPVIVLILALIFRNATISLLKSLSERMTKAEIAGTSFEFEAAAGALKTSVVEAMDQYKDQPNELSKSVIEQLEKLQQSISLPPITTQFLKGKRLMWVTELAENFTYEMSLLRQFGARLLLVYSVNEALEKAKDRSIDLIILDTQNYSDMRDDPSVGSAFLTRFDHTYEDMGRVILYGPEPQQINAYHYEPVIGRAEDPARLIKLIYDIYTV